MDDYEGGGKRDEIPIFCAGTAGYKINIHAYIATNQNMNRANLCSQQMKSLFTVPGQQEVAYIDVLELYI